ncbi:hypothetical transcript [Echinococcus multilocularis]|uniref:Hypothetical transcript n=1 Tax=Echinococcus multilocularis TaxID=6211 RepID=A0A087VWF1_ECHMU|nr:hypothetical transcript [Echinococcus multilocularis]
MRIAFTAQDLHRPTLRVASYILPPDPTLRPLSSHMSLPKSTDRGGPPLLLLILVYQISLGVAALSSSVAWFYNVYKGVKEVKKLKEAYVLESDI